ncbi:MAG: hypothetical protein M1830_005822 [Pleopsidium flavum]|nr:MAG: hypothetical protein M1830_005822 [Pleopsidium flavum]
MHEQALTHKDSSVLTQIFDPESAPTAGIFVVDPSLPNDPHIRDPELFYQLQQREQELIASFEPAPTSTTPPKPPSETLFSTAYGSLSALIADHPTYASARNNRAQLIRLQYGTTALLTHPSPTNPSTSHYATIALADLNKAITLLTPPSPTSALSPTQRRTLAQAHTQRAVLYHAAAKTLSTSQPAFTVTVPELEHWTRHGFEEAASSDFFMGGRYGNEIGKALAVHTNPTAKLCGQMVREAMRREFAPAKMGQS